MKNIALLVLGLFSVAAMAAKTESFKMYTQPHAKPNPNCDTYTALDIQYGKAGITATLVNRVGGACELFVEPNPRTYIAPREAKKDACGRIIYSYLARGTGEPIFKLVDYRNTICDMMIPALIVVTELDEKGNEYPLYSLDH